MGINDTILAFQRQQLPQIWLKNHHLAINTTIFRQTINQLTPIYKPRHELENDPNYKQPIPYLLLRNPQNQLATFTRQGNEKRLHGLWSCGIGGHVDQADQAPTNTTTLHNALLREMQEELNHFTPTTIPTFIGIINEEQTKVGRTHIGIVYLLDITKDENPQAGEELGTIHWQTIPAIQKLKTEHWSQLAIKLIN